VVRQFIVDRESREAGDSLSALSHNDYDNLYWEIAKAGSCGFAGKGICIAKAKWIFFDDR
jgi:hypothetical protein